MFGLFDHVTKRTGMAFCCTSQEKGTSRRAARQAVIGYNLTCVARVDEVDELMERTELPKSTAQPAVVDF